MSTAAVSFRKVEGQGARAVATIRGDNRLAAAVLLHDRIWRVNAHPPRSAAYLFVLPDGRAYVLHEAHALLQNWIRHNSACMVGVYDCRGVRGGPEAPSIERLLEDIEQHMGDLSAAA